MISPKTFQFLKDLVQNNERPWFQSNKHRYEEARANFEDFIGRLMLQIARFDPDIADLDPRKCIFRIYRDTRFSPDKRPYKTNLGAYLVSAHSRPHDRAGYYIHLQPGNNFLAGGAYLPPSPWLNAIRDVIDNNGQKLLKILDHPDFKKYFGKMEGEILKTVPRGYAPDHPHIELLRHKSFLASHSFSEEDAGSEDFILHATKVFAALKPFDDFLNDALK
jgi:uncharacterized protein (TIGR02453 family)